MCVCVCARERERERERERQGEFELSEKISRNFSKFCEPLEKIRARFSEKKILPKKAHWYAKNKRTFAEQHTVDAF